MVARNFRFIGVRGSNSSEEIDARPEPRVEPTDIRAQARAGKFAFTTAPAQPISTFFYNLRKKAQKAGLWI